MVPRPRTLSCPLAVSRLCLLRDREKSLQRCLDPHHIFITHVRARRSMAHTRKGGEGGEAEGWGGAMEDNVAFQFSLGPAKTAVVLTITEEVNARV